MSEFYGLFDEELKDKTTTHFWNYPRSPNSNAFIERSSRTLPEQFLNGYDNDLNDINIIQSFG